ncbi:macrophage mannose receptor 1-like [Excalfactoria chinensis]|uniref:macrophage mannose receptor 1-like n=1 Tax=Excalfactoria chinensis TaxID=46218 RepID=UPI003B3AAC11
MASRSFLLYNKAHNMCVEARGQQLTATTCRPQKAAQRFQWLPGQRLWNAERRSCVTASAGLNLSSVTLQPCREDGKLQGWECGAGGLLGLAGKKLYFNYGNNVKQTVMLYVGDREWSRWVVYGSQEELCARSCCPICPQGWIYFGGSCYFYSKKANTWDGARGSCSAHGAQLLEVDGPKEKAHIQSTLSSSSWLGIRDEELEGTWKRANGSILNPEQSSWQWNEPNGGQRENCAVVRMDGCGTTIPAAARCTGCARGSPGHAKRTPKGGGGHTWIWDPLNPPSIHPQCTLA